MVANYFCDDQLMAINRLIVLALDQCPYVIAQMITVSFSNCCGLFSIINNDLASEEILHIATVDELH